MADRTLNVSQLNQFIKRLVEGSAVLKRVVVEGGVGLALGRDERAVGQPRGRRAPGCADGVEERGLEEGPFPRSASAHGPREGNWGFGLRAVIIRQIPLLVTPIALLFFISDIDVDSSI